MTPVSAGVIGKPIVVVGSIHRAGQHQLPVVIEALNALRFRFGFAERREKNSSQNRNDRDHHEELNQSETELRDRPLKSIGTKIVHTPGGPVCATAWTLLPCGAVSKTKRDKESPRTTEPIAVSRLSFRAAL